MTKLEQKFSEIILDELQYDQLEIIGIDTEKCAINCTSICKEEMKKFDVWKHEKLYEQIGDKFYRSRLTGDRITTDQLIALYESENQK